MHRKFKELGNFFFFFVSKFFKIHFFVEQSSINQTLETEKFDAEREKFVEMMRESVEKKVFFLFIFFLQENHNFSGRNYRQNRQIIHSNGIFFIHFFFIF